MERSHAARWSRTLVLASLAGCADVDPQVGPSQESCGVDAAPVAIAGSAGYGPASSTENGASQAPTTAQLCAPDAGGPCDVCESTYCCPTRMACYTDPVCICADHAMDQCIGSAGNGGAMPSPSQVAACEDAFSAHGRVEQARIACQNTWCATACASP